MNDTQIVTKDKLIADLRIVVTDAEELLKATAGQAGEKVTAMRDRIGRSLEQAKNRLSQLEDEALDKGKAAARATDQYVHDNPWKSVGLAAGVGFLLGWLTSRR